MMDAEDSMLVDDNKSNNGEVNDTNDNSRDEMTDGEEGESPNAVEEEEEEEEENTCLPSIFANPSISVYWRRGIPIYFMATLALLIASDVGSGVAAITQVFYPNGSFPENTLLEASVFTSMKELWNTGSYALTIFIAITSIAWPYVKLLLSLYAWLRPIRHPLRRERLIIALDALGKWSFVDVVVFVEIVVVFRDSIQGGAGAILEVWIVPRWGLFGFVAATMLSLIGTHAVLYHHRRTVYHQKEAQNEDSSDRALRSIANLATWKTAVLTLLLAAGFGLYLAGCCIYTFRVQKTRGDIEEKPQDYSIVSTGRDLSTSGTDSNQGAMTWLQIIWFVLGVVMPLVTSIMFGILLWAPMSRQRLEQLFIWTEVAFAWSSAEVFVISTIFAVLEIPTFGDGLIESGCPTCYVVDSELLLKALLPVLALGTIFHLTASIWMFQIGHKRLVRSIR